MSTPISSLGNSRAVETGNGPLFIYGAVPQSELASLTMDPSLRMFRAAERQKEALIKISSLEQGAVFVAKHDTTIVGYCTFHPASSGSRWADTSLPVIELGALEVASSWRFMRVGRTILEVAFEAGAFEDYIVASTEYAWHWDLESTRLSVWQYRKLLQDILTNVGLQLQKTDDPEIIGHPANMLTVRHGARVTPEDRERFTALCLSTSQVTD
jgi:acetoin utilization protein AcuA